MPDGLKLHRILVIDDNPSIHEDFRKVLCAPRPSHGMSALQGFESALFGSTEESGTANYELDSAFQGEEALKLIEAASAAGRPYSMVFCDMRMPPGWDGVQTLRAIWRICPTVQAAICTAYSDYTPEQITSALGTPRQMVIVRKPFDRAEVRQLAAMVCDKVEAHHQRAVLEQVVESSVAELRHAANHDTLTGLANRRVFLDRVAHALSRAKRNPNLHFAVLFIDCNQLKTINDSMGHQAGDALLQQMSQRLEDVLRDTDAMLRIARPNGVESLTARIGGDEFAILLEDIRSDIDAARVAERLILSLGHLYTIDGTPIRSGVCIGATTNAIAYQTADDMLSDADAAMCQARRDGSGRYVVFDQTLHDLAVARLRAQADLRKGVESGQIIPHYQPIIRTSDCRIVGFEALARWAHPTQGLIQPAEFIGLAEETGLIVQLGQCILETACMQLVEWERAFPQIAGLTMSVNISRKQLSSREVVTQLVDLLTRTGLSPHRLKLEVTESTMMEHSATAFEVLTQLQALGVQLQIDDFGTGYSSLSCLSQMPLNGMKIDRSFLASKRSTANDAILGAITGLARGLQLPIVAEGVETEAQLAQLRALGCEFAQGYLLGRPMDAVAITTLLAEVAVHTARAA